eukprot:scaffold7647_cov403-Prasinococcus_capsulatus_cf.AAC.4
MADLQRRRWHYVSRKIVLLPRRGSAPADRHDRSRYFLCGGHRAISSSAVARGVRGRRPGSGPLDELNSTAGAGAYARCQRRARHRTDEALSGCAWRRAA